MNPADVARIEAAIAQAESINQYIAIDRELEAAQRGPVRDRLRRDLERKTAQAMSDLMTQAQMEAVRLPEGVIPTAIKFIRKASLQRQGISFEGSRAFVALCELLIGAEEVDAAIDAVDARLAELTDPAEMERILQVAGALRNFDPRRAEYHWADVGGSAEMLAFAAIADERNDAIANYRGGYAFERLRTILEQGNAQPEEIGQYMQEIAPDEQTLAMEMIQIHGMRHVIAATQEMEDTIGTDEIRRRMAEGDFGFEDAHPETRALSERLLGAVDAGEMALLDIEMPGVGRRVEAAMRKIAAEVLVEQRRAQQDLQGPPDRPRLGM